MELDFAPVVQARSSHSLVVRSKPELADKMQRRERSGAEPGYVAGVRRNFRFNERDLKT
jgi:hypothetical protein